VDRGVELAVHQTDDLVPLFGVSIAKRRQNNVVLGLKDLDSKLKPQSVLEAVGLVLGGIEFKLHDRALCETHIACNRD
jgi:hypothetical protein